MHFKHESSCCPKNCKIRYMVLNNILKLINVAKEFIFSNITHTNDIFWTHWFDSWLYVFKPLDLRIYLFIHVVSFNYFNVHPVQIKDFETFDYVVFLKLLVMV